MNGRVYDPQLARFLSPDPFVQEPFNGQNWNRYSYVLNNPLKYTDPTGYKKVWRCTTTHSGQTSTTTCTEYDDGTFEFEIPSSRDVGDALQSGVEDVIDFTGIADVGGAVLDAYVAIDLEQYDQLGNIAMAAGVNYVAKKAKMAEKAVPEKVKEKITTVIGRVKDLQKLGKNEQSLLSRLPDKGSPKANWKQNSGVLRQEMKKNQPIKDASPDDKKGAFLNAERNLLESKGWSFDRASSFWNPPGI